MTMARTTFSRDRRAGRAGSLRTLALGAGLAAALAVSVVPIVAAAQPGAAQPAMPVVDAAPVRYCLVERADARDRPSLDTLKALGDCEIERRFATLDRLDAMVAGAPAITAEHRRLLRFANATNPTSFEVTRSGLESLKVTIDRETDLAALRSEIQQIATDYRVYLLVAPKAQLVRGADATVEVAGHFGPLGEELQALIDRARAAGRDTTAAEAALASMNVKVDQAEALAEPLPGTLLPLSVAAYNDGTAGPELASARASIGQARDLLRGARADARQVISLLRG
jgi:hypothetical protein